MLIGRSNLLGFNPETTTICADWHYNSGVMSDTTVLGGIVGARVRDARVARGWNQSDLARRAGVSTSYISRLESGVYRAPSLDRIRKVATALGLTVAELSEPMPAVADGAGLRAELHAMGFRSDEAPLVEEIAADLLQRSPRQRRALLEAIRTLLPPVSD